MTFGNPVKPRRTFGQLGITGSGSPTSDTKSLSKPHVLILLDSWGTGAHLVVADRLSLELQKQGCEVTIFTNKRSSQLIGIFSATGPDNPVIIDDIPFGHEAEYLRSLMQDPKANFRPDVVVSEHFPLCDNTKPLAQHMLACVQAAKDVAKEQKREIKVCGLVRDVPSIDHLDPACKETLKGFDTLLVRGDPSFINYRQLFSQDDFKLLEPKLCYTGYMLDSLSTATPAKRPTPNDSVVVSLGGGDKSDNDPIYASIIRSIPVIERQHSLRHKTWHFFVGSDRQLAALRPVVDEVNHYSEMTAQERSTGSKTPIELHVFNQDRHGKSQSSDVFASTLRHADFAICRGGLTAIEATAANVPTLIIPRKHDEKSEQDIRAEQLQRSPQSRVSILDERNAITPIAICESTKTAFEKQRRNHQPPFNIDGSLNASRSLIQLHNKIEPQSLGVGAKHTV